MSFAEIKYENPSESIDILNASSRIISEFIVEETNKGESINNRANISLCITGIFISIIIAISSNISIDSYIPILVKVLYICINILMIIIIYNSIKVILVKQGEKLSPDIVNDIQTLSYIEALKYEIKWKMCQYNEMNKININKLYYLHKVQRSLLLSILYLILIAFIFNFNNWFMILEYECYFKTTEMVIGAILIVFSILLNNILEKFSFWNN